MATSTARGAGKQFRANNFDLLRIFAASQVMLCHIVAHLHIPAPQWLIKLLYAFPGVPVFFVISGFLISASYERSTDLKSYWRNRVLRIFPALWCCILATVFVAALFGFSFMSEQAAFWILSQFAGVIYTPELLGDFGVGSYNGSLWTIPVELQFYVLLPVLYWLTRRAEKDRTKSFILVWLLFVAIGFAASLLFPPLQGPENEPILQKLVRYSFASHFFLFMTGVALQRMRVQETKWIAGKGAYWLAAYLAFYYLMPAATPATYVPMTLLLGLAALSVAYTATGASKILLRGNDISYGVYIYHGLLINVFVQMGLTGGIAGLTLAACTYLVGYLSWVAVERPLLRIKRQSVAPIVAPAMQIQGWLRNVWRTPTN